MVATRRAPAGELAGGGGRGYRGGVVGVARHTRVGAGGGTHRAGLAVQNHRDTVIHVVAQVLPEAGVGELPLVTGGTNDADGATTKQKEKEKTQVVEGVRER